MIVRLRLFAGARQIAGCDQMTLELPDGATIADLRAELGRRIPAIAALAECLMFAVETRYATDELELTPGAEVACLPPVSGG